MKPEAWEEGAWAGDGFQVGQAIDFRRPDEITIVASSSLGSGHVFVSVAHQSLELARDIGTAKMREITEWHHFASLASTYTPEPPPRPLIPLGTAFRSIRQKIRIRHGGRIWPHRRTRMAGK